MTLQLFLSDTISILISFVISYELRNKGFFRLFLEEIQPLPVYLTALPFAIILFLLVSKSIGLYDYKNRIRLDKYTVLCLKSLVFWLLLIMSGSYLYKYDYSRIILILTFIFSLLFVISFRFILISSERKRLKMGIDTIRVLIIGSGRPAREIARKLRDLDSLRFNIIGFIDENSNGSSDYPVIGKLSDVKRIIKTKKINEVYISDPNLSHKDILELITSSIGMPITIRIESNVFDLISGPLDSRNIDDLPVLQMSLKRKSTFNIIKRLIDITGSLIGLIVLSPVFIFTSILIYFEDKENPFIIQKRVGLKNRLFKMYKFRTMTKKSKLYQNAPKNENDTRITKIGRTLRKYSLDELPQLLNILKGDMTFVGPRPEMPFIVRNYSNWQKKRLLVKPGLTGLWQILGRKDLPLTYNLEYDFYYILTRSFTLDASILMKTVATVINGKGAY